MERYFLEWIESGILSAILAKTFNKYDQREKSVLRVTEKPILDPFWEVGFHIRISSFVHSINSENMTTLPKPDEH